MKNIKFEEPRNSIKSKFNHTRPFSGLSSELHESIDNQEEYSLRGIHHDGKD